MSSQNEQAKEPKTKKSFMRPEWRKVARLIGVECLKAFAMGAAATAGQRTMAKALELYQGDRGGKVVPFPKVKVGS